jgi:outer membrane immunogenic protein
MRNLKLIVSTAVAVTAIVGIGSASAADLPARTYTKAPAMVDPGYNWSGFYIGLNAGGDWSRTNESVVLAPGFPDSAANIAGRTAGSAGRLNSNGFTGGGQAGYNWQTGHFVFGVEADIESLGGSTSRTLDLVNFGLPGPGFNLTQQSSSPQWLATFRGRLGFAADRVLFYGTGGVAVGKVNYFDLQTFGGAPSQGGSTSNVQTGWTAGAGVEWAFANQWSLRGEYLHVDLGNSSFTSVNSAVPAAVITHNHNFTTDIGRLAINYKFGGPVAAKY